MTSTISGDVGGLRSSMVGAVCESGDAGYEEARRIWNGDIDRYPAVVARCTSPADVAAAVTFARERGLEIAVRGGGHGYSGSAVCDGGLMIDLSPLDGVRVDPDARRAWVGGGAKLADLDAASQEYGLAAPAGVISHTGIGGLTLGGGMGWLTSKLGLSIDALESAEVVLADGRCVRASASEHPDLFWALRGGGGNFGVVTEFEFRLAPVGPMVQVGMLFWGLDQGWDALRAARDVVNGLPEDIGGLIAVALNAPPAPFVPEQYHLMPGHALLLGGFGTPDQHADALAAAAAACPPLFQFASTIPYVGLQSMLDDAAPWGICAYEKALYLDDLTDEAIAVLVDRSADKTHPLSFAPIFRLSGAYSRVDDDATAYGGRRRPQYVVNIEGVAADREALAPEREWVRSVWNQLRPFAHDSGGYVNFMAETDDDRVRETYGVKYERLARIKGVYDPTNLFHRNMNIKPDNG